MGRRGFCVGCGVVVCVALRYFASYCLTLLFLPFARSSLRVKKELGNRSEIEVRCPCPLPVGFKVDETSRREDTL